MPSRRHVALHAIALAALAAAPLLIAGRGALAQAPGVPAPEALEILVKRTLMTLNDANRTGDYGVLHASASETLRQQFTPEALKASFKPFSEQRIDIAQIVALRPAITQKASIDADGVLSVAGHFETRPNRVSFTLRFLQADSDWRWLGLQVDFKPPQAAVARAPAKK